MDTDALARSTLADLQGTGTLFHRQQCSLGVLRINFDRAARRLVLFAPDHASALRAYVDELDAIAREPASRQRPLVGALLERFDRWVRAPAPAPVAAPPPPPSDDAPPPPDDSALEPPPLPPRAL